MENENPHTLKYEDTDPEIQIRSDLWSTMSTTDLLHQRELVVTKLFTLGKMLSWSASPSVTNMYLTIQNALEQINSIIDSKTTKILT